MADGGLFVYKCAQDAHEQITRLSDFVSPTVVAMWNLRWQVNGFLNAYPEASQEDLVARFALGSGVRGNEIRRACVDVTWEKQKARFASILLMNTISIFEEFTDRIASLALSGLAKDKATRDLQFPTVHTRKGYQRAYAAFGPPVPELNGVFVSSAGKGRGIPELTSKISCCAFASLRKFGTPRHTMVEEQTLPYSVRTKISRQSPLLAN